jgi:hypothetical protein
LPSNSKRFTKLTGGQLALPQGNKLDVPIAQDLLPALVGLTADQVFRHAFTLQAREDLLNMVNRCSGIDNTKSKNGFTLVFCRRHKRKPVL